MAVLKYRDPATGEFKRLTGGSGAKEVEISAIEGTLTLDDDTLALLADNTTYIRYNGEIYRLFSVATPIKNYISITDDARKQITVDFTAKTCVYAESSVKIPEIVGTDGITIDKAESGEKVEISGKNFVEKVTKTNTKLRVYGIKSNSTNNYIFEVGAEDIWCKPSVLPRYNQISYIGKTEPTGALITATPVNDYQCTTKKYVDDNFVDKLRFTNLEQALNGYILDTTEESYTDLDSAVLKDSVTVDDNIYPIADKTRALVSKIEGKTVKMVQLLNKSNYPATVTKEGVTFTNNGDGSVSVNGTYTGSDTEYPYFILQSGTLDKTHKYLLSGCPKGGSATTYFLTFFGTSHDIGEGGIYGNIGSYSNLQIRVNTTSSKITFYPQLFDLTAMYGYGNEPTTVEQFKQDFPDFYGYEDGEIYASEISGVKFSGKNLLQLKLDDKVPVHKATATINGDTLTVNGTNAGGYAQLKTRLPVGDYVLSAVDDNKNAGAKTWYIIFKKINAGDIIKQGYAPIKFSITEATDVYVLIYPLKGATGTEFTAVNYNLQIESGNEATTYEPYSAVNVSLSQTFDLHGIGDDKDYLEITKNEDNDYYTLKKVQCVDKYTFTGAESFDKSGYTTDNYIMYYATNVQLKMGIGFCNKFITKLKIDSDVKGVLFGVNNTHPYFCVPESDYADVASFKAYLTEQFTNGDPVIIYYVLREPVETVISTNLTYEQVTAIRTNGGLIEVVGNANKNYVKPTVNNTVVYRLTAKTEV